MKNLTGALKEEKAANYYKRSNATRHIKSQMEGDDTLFISDNLLFMRLSMRPGCAMAPFIPPEGQPDYLYPCMKGNEPIIALKGADLLDGWVKLTTSQEGILVSELESTRILYELPQGRGEKPLSYRLFTYAVDEQPRQCWLDKRITDVFACDPDGLRDWFFLLTANEKGTPIVRVCAYHGIVAVAVPRSFDHEPIVTNV